LEKERAARLEAEAALVHRTQELSDFVDNAVEGLHKVDANGTILWANRAELTLLGYEWDEYVGRSIVDFHADREVIDDILRRLLGGDAIYDYRARLRCKDGSIKHVSIHSNGCFRDGSLLYTRCFTRDATLVNEREDLVIALDHAGRAKDEFLAMLGHELRNPLAPIVTALRLMRLRGDARNMHERGMIERQVNHMVRLVDDLLDVSRITSGKVELRPERVSVGDVIGEAVEMAGILLEQRQHHLTLDVEPDLMWTGDPARLAQVLSNLLNNAARYTHVGGRIELRAWRDQADIRVSIQDNGQGIALDQIDRIFQLFHQGKQSLDRPEGGLGIGLALAKSLVEMHDGQLSARSDGPGLGSEFTVRLPITSDRPSLAPPMTTPLSSFADVSTGKRVAIVDDNVDNAEVVGEFLGAEGFCVEVFHDPASALSRFQLCCPEVAILDIGLPVMDGYTLAAEIRKLPGGEDCHVLAMTGYGTQADVARSALAGFAAHLVKPVPPERLVNAVRKLFTG